MIPMGNQLSLFQQYYQYPLFAKVPRCGAGGLSGIIDLPLQRPLNSLTTIEERYMKSELLQPL
jgi:hypothetical protein